MLKGKGFRSIGRVEVKAETTTPGEAQRRRRTITKMEFNVEESGAIVKGQNFFGCRYASSFTDENMMPGINGDNNIPAEILVDDSRATSLSIKSKKGKFYCGASMERFSGHTGICRVLGNKNVPIVPHALQLGEFIRIGSVGLIVCEVNRHTSDEYQEVLSEDELYQLKRNYLSSPLLESQSISEIADFDFSSIKSSGKDGENSSDEADYCQNNGSGIDTSDDEEDAVNQLREAYALPRQCYICYDDEQNPEENPLVAPCKCKGDTKYVHLHCLQRWNNNEDLDNENAKVCAVTNTDGLDVCSICKSTYLTSVRLDDGRMISLLAKKLPPPYVTFAVVTQHETRTRATALTNTRFQLSFAGISQYKHGEYLTIGRSTSNNMVLRYRTVSQLHAKLKFQSNNFYLMDAGSSNGTMLFLSRPLELPWGKTVHVKMGRTVLALKAKKRWKWGNNSSDRDEESDNLEVGFGDVPEERFVESTIPAIDQ